jgi:hypothetical protein
MTIAEMCVCSTVDSPIEFEGQGDPTVNEGYCNPIKIVDMPDFMLKEIVNITRVWQPMYSLQNKEQSGCIRQLTIDLHCNLFVDRAKERQIVPCNDCI